MHLIILLVFFTDNFNKRNNFQEIWIHFGCAMYVEWMLLGRDLFCICNLIKFMKIHCTRHVRNQIRKVKSMMERRPPHLNAYLHIMRHRDFFLEQENISRIVVDNSSSLDAIIMFETIFYIWIKNWFIELGSGGFKEKKKLLQNQWEPINWICSASSLMNFEPMRMVAVAFSFIMFIQLKSL